MAFSFVSLRAEGYYRSQLCPPICQSALRSVCLPTPPQGYNLCAGHNILFHVSYSPLVRGGDMNLNHLDNHLAKGIRPILCLILIIGRPCETLTLKRPRCLTCLIHLWSIWGARWIMAWLWQYSHIRWYLEIYKSIPYSHYRPATLAPYRPHYFMRLIPMILV